jgi:hypothetical protein
MDLIPGKKPEILRVLAATRALAKPHLSANGASVIKRVLFHLLVAGAFLALARPASGQG